MISIKKNIFQHSILFFLLVFSGTEGFASFYYLEKGDSTTVSELKLLTDRYADNSVLSSGKWVKISVEESGIYKITYSKLKDWGFSTPEQVRVFGYGGEMLPAANSVPRPDDLPEAAIWHHNSAIYFYAQNIAIWNWDNSQQMFLHDLHRYSNTAYYFLSDIPGNIKTVSEQAAETGNANVTVTNFDDYKYHEVELRKLGTSGAHYFGEDFFNGSSRSFNFAFPSRDVSAPVKLYVRVAAKGEKVSIFNVNLKNQSSAILSLTVESTASKYDYAKEKIDKATFNSNTGNIDIDIKFSSTGNPGYLDYIVINTRSSLKMNDSQLIFRDKESNQTGNIALFKISNANSETVVWDITNRNEIKKVPAIISGSSLEFKTSVSELKEFVAFNPSGNFPVPKDESIENQNLHKIKNVDYIIVAHKDFHPYAQKLADLHFQYDGLTTIIVTPEQIYNEFSYGHKDATAIRSFAKMIYDRNGGIKYLLLFGDGSYDNKVLLPNRNSKYEILTWQTEHSLNDNSSYVSDDYFGFLDDNEGSSHHQDKLDIAIGRFPVNSISAAATCVDKVRKYMEEQSNGTWRNQITFLADERGDLHYEPQHLQQAETCSNVIETLHPQFHVNKIYMDSYPKVTTSSGKTYPMASEAANRAVNEGTLIFNYIGHGSPTSMAHEKIITRVHVKKWKNIKSLAFFLTFTCELSRFDDHNIVSLGEEMLLHPYGGAVALFTTTRQVGIGSNGDLNRYFHDYVFNEEDTGQKQSIGKALMLAKNRQGGDNKLRFVFLGDPAIKLVHPDIKMKIDEITDVNRNEVVDTIKALSQIGLRGSVTTNSDEIIKNFNGIVEITVYDKELTLNTLCNDCDTYDVDTILKGNKFLFYDQYSNIIYRGRATITNGIFQSEFIVPHDIRYNYDKGKISLYAYSTDEGDSRQAGGANKDFIVGGFDDNADLDIEGPQITLYLNHKSFKSGDTTGSSPLLFAFIKDESGLNIGNGIGHDLLLTIDGDKENVIILNNYFQGDVDNFRAGTVIFQLPDLESGKHEISLKAWDTHNNSSIATLNFIVEKGKELKISNFILHPVPVKTFNPIYFSFETDEPNSAITVSIDGINSAGGITGLSQREMISYGSSVEESQLDLTSIGIRTPGIYFIRFIITTDTGKKGQIVQKIIVRP